MGAYTFYGLSWNGKQSTHDTSMMMLLSRVIRIQLFSCLRPDTIDAHERDTYITCRPIHIETARAHVRAINWDFIRACHLEFFNAARTRNLRIVRNCTCNIRQRGASQSSSRRNDISNPKCLCVSNPHFFWPSQQGRQVLTSPAHKFISNVCCKGSAPLLRIGTRENASGWHVGLSTGATKASTMAQSYACAEIDVVSQYARSASPWSTIGAVIVEKNFSYQHCCSALLGLGASTSCYR